MRVAALLIALVGCTAVDGSAQEELARELAGRAAGASQTCLRPPLGTSPVAADRRTIVLRTADAVWVNRLAANCQALAPTSSLIIETSTGEYCRDDRVRGLEPGSSSPGPSCRLGDWTPYRGSH